MKLLPVLLLSLVTAVGTVVVYDQLRRDPAPPQIALEPGDGDVAALEQRLAAVESARRPMLEAAGADPRILERLAALEALQRVPAGAGGPREEEPPLARRAPPENAPRAGTAADEQPTDDEIRRFRRLRDAAARQDRIRKNAARVDKALATLSLNLSKRQRARLSEAFTDFRPRIDQIWGEAKSQARETQKAGGTVDRGEIVATTTALIQSEFVTTIGDVVAQADAEAIAQALLTGGK